MNNSQMDEDLLSWTTNIVSSYVSNNKIAPEDMPGFIEQTYKTLLGITHGDNVAEDSLSPAVAIKDSITPDYIICLEDGKKLKMLKLFGLLVVINMTMYPILGIMLWKMLLIVLLMTNKGLLEAQVLEWQF